MVDLSAVIRSPRTSALAALVALVAVIAVAAGAFARRPLFLVFSIGCLAIALGLAAYALNRTGTKRTVAAVTAILMFVVAIALVLTSANLALAVLAVALVAIMGTLTRHALGPEMVLRKPSSVPGTRVGPAARGVLILNPWAGNGKVERFRLEQEASRRGIEPLVLESPDDLPRLARSAAARGADVIGVAGGDGSQALVAEVAMKHDLAYVCVPAGTRNHLAMELGLDRGDPVAALDAFGEAVEHRIDLGLVCDRVFVNNVTMGLYARIVQSPEYRDRKLETVLETLSEVIGPGAAPFDLQFTGFDGTEYSSAALLMVSNGPYELGGEGFGSRPRIDGGTLGIVAVGLSGDASRSDAPRRLIQWTETSYEVRSDRPLEVAVDGEAIVMDPPLQFRILPAALRARIPRHAPGHPTAATSPRPAWSTIRALLQTAAGRPLTRRRTTTPV